MIKILHSTELGHGLEQGADSKIKVKLKAGSALTLDDAGLDVTIPAFPEVPTALKAVEYEAATHKLKFTDTKSAVTEVELPTPTVDVKVTNLALNEQDELVASLSDGGQVKVSLAKFVDQAKAASAYWDEIKALPTFASDAASAISQNEAAAKAIATKVLELLKGEEVQDFTGNSKGYLLKATLA